jgi:hypothetical protein
MIPIDDLAPEAILGTELGRAAALPLHLKAATYASILRERESYAEA